MEKYGTVRKATDDNIIQRIRFACRIIRARDTQPEYVTLIISQGNNDYANAVYIYVIRTLLILIYSSDISKDTGL